MIDELIFFNQDWIGPIAIGGLLLWTLFVWKEWSGKLRPKFYLSVFVALISLISLAMIALKPMVWSNDKTKVGVLLTESYQKDRLDSLKKVYKNLKVIPYKMNEPMEEVMDSIAPLFILGTGIQSYDLWQLKNVPTTFLGTIALNGITHLNYKQELSIGEELIVLGRYNSPKNGHHMLLVDSGGTTIDSVLVDSTTTDFKLSADLKVKGNHMFEIREKDLDRNTVSSDPLPITVVPREKLKVLMLNSFPTFESKYLKNFLAETGHELRVRSRLTKGKFKYEYFNTERRPFNSFSEELLKSIDLIIIDASSYVNLANSSIKNIHQAMQQYGLGVLILPDNIFFKQAVQTSNFEFIRNKSSKVNLDEESKLTLEKYPFVFKEDYQLEAIHHTEDNIITAYRRDGKGRIGTSVIQNSFQLVLDGNSEGYTWFWSKIISAISKRRHLGVEWRASSQFAFQNEPYTFQIRTTEEKPEVHSKDSRIPLIQNPYVLEVWNGTTYPRNKGWNHIELKNDSTNIFNFYVMDSLNWRSVTSYKNMMLNKREFRALADIPNTRKRLVAIDQLWFFLIFVLGMGYLWFIPKVYSN